ncbi:unnamed protein product [Porites evermanni]|uniref:Transmembrane protein 135 N-terminal domain-containing protein n=1 Tax=Porites evermanni TaxID=104178 RepID=A0ABN8LIM9_9CNID|nr:unnamed protein product [Porites evermanni]
MTVFSKILPYFTTTLSCHELAHTWTPSCSSASAEVFRSCFIESLKIYGLLYLVGGILRRAGMKYFRVNYLLDVIRSSLFLAVNGGGLVVNVCLIRKLFGSFNYLSMIFVPGLIASLMAILIEKKGRRSTLALYMTNLATETTYNMLKERSLIKPIPNGEIILFCASTATMMYLYRKKDGLTDGLVNALIRYFLGSNNSGHRQEISGTEQSQLMERKKYNNDWHISWLQPTLKALGTGYLIQLMLMLAGQIKFIVTNPRRLLRTFYHKDCIRCGLFLGSFVAIFKNVEGVLGNLRKKSDEINALFAGGLAGLSMMFYKSSTIALYLASKMSEIVYKQGVSAGVLPSIPYAEILTYTFSTAFLFHACTWEVHSVRPSYWRYLNVVTGKRFCEINRAKIDELYGTDSTRLFPKDDLYKSLNRKR